MGQEAILEFLKKNKLGTMKEIAEGTGVTPYAVWQSLNRMENLDIEKIIIQKKYKYFVWKIKGEEIPEDKLKKYRVKLKGGKDGKNNQKV